MNDRALQPSPRRQLRLRGIDSVPDVRAESPDSSKTVRNINEFGKRLVSLAIQRGNPHEVIEVTRNMQRDLLRVTLRRMVESGYPFGEYQIAGQTLEFAILEGVRRTTSPFYKLFIEQIDVALELYRLQTGYVESWIYYYHDIPVWRRARAAAMIEATLGVTMRERLAVYYYYRENCPTARVADMLGAENINIRLALARILRDAHARAPHWRAKIQEHYEKNRRPTRRGGRRR